MSVQNTKRKTSGAASLFDLRWIIALLFGIYGIVVTVMGIGFTSQAELAKAGGINANLWTGIPMIVVAALFAVWAQLRPVRVPTDTGSTDPDTPEGSTGSTSAPGDPFSGS